MNNLYVIKSILFKLFKFNFIIYDHILFLSNKCLKYWQYLRLDVDIGKYGEYRKIVYVYVSRYGILVRWLVIKGSSNYNNYNPYTM